MDGPPLLFEWSLWPPALSGVIGAARQQVLVQGAGRGGWGGGAGGSLKQSGLAENPPCEAGITKATCCLASAQFSDLFVVTEEINLLTCPAGGTPLDNKQQ